MKVTAKVIVSAPRYDLSGFIGYFHEILFMVVKILMKKAHFLNLMNFPDEWASLDMYPDELALIQIADYEPGSEDASEHFRNGAFHWWLKVGKPTRGQLEKLMLLVSIDPDPLMGEDVMSYIRQVPGFDQELEYLANKLLQGRKAY